MQIEITEAAAAKLSEQINGQTGFLKLKYDTEGCGCVVNGVPALWFVSKLHDDDLEIQTNAGSIYVERSKEVFFDEKMKIDFVEAANYYQLKSPSQYLNPTMSFYNKTSV
ncbi:iron-sulfur cluster biosynthesis family protein [Bacillus sp. 03113]|uniref:iron-sulfur cluster biosynthesis family protein n=1 Tax=Bacillus sp. 03113 TaxID=2578211 RepID=UPI00114233E3|nr:iron-sulfur cluster biosynthesis family protein [Bacillus sp. 03113]